MRAGALIVAATALWSSAAHAQTDLKPIFYPVEPPNIPKAEPATADWSGRERQPQYSKFYARIVLEDGAEMVVAPTVQVEYGDQCKVQVFRSGTVQVLVPRVNPGGPADAREPGQVCPARIMLPGYRSVFGIAPDQLITMKRLSANEGSTVSITVLSASPAAQKEYAKGELAMSRGRWEEAANRFRKAIAISPNYSTAWSELGQALESAGEFDAAGDAYRRALACDRLYLKPYEQLASIAARQNRWRDVLSATDQAFRLNPVEFPGIYYFNALAKSNLGDREGAEKTARQAIEVDAHSLYPRSYVILARALVERGDYPGALEACRAFLKRVPAGPEAATVANWAASLERSTSAKK